MAARALRAIGGLIFCGLLLPDRTPAACPPEQYRENIHGQEVCCNYCAAGQQIMMACTASNKASTCVNCKEKSYNPEKVRYGCRLCTVCSRERGSLEKTPCTNSTDATCECPEGSKSNNDHNSSCSCDAGNEIVDNKCLPCKPGYFSTKENSFCRPWTNCSAMGQTISEQGSAIKDVKCTKTSPVTVGLSTTTLTASSPTHRRKVTSPQNVTTTNQILTNISPTSNKLLDWGTLSLILIGTILLLLSAAIILTMIMQINRKKMNRRFQRCDRIRVPVQEESTSSDSSSPKDCSA
ncbi:hypothetical protein PRIEUP_LOCUS14915 [Pristimantis euphronides]